MCLDSSIACWCRKLIKVYILLVQDSDERAVAYIAGKAPSRWGRFGVDPPVAAPMMVLSPQVLPPNASSAQIDRNTQIRRSHPLYADVALRLLTEIMNSRLFTTVRSSPAWSVLLTCDSLYALGCNTVLPTEEARSIEQILIEAFCGETS